MKKAILVSPVVGVHKLRLDQGDEAFEEIAKYCKENRITAADINMIGACTWVEIYFYNPDSKEYEKLQIKENLEVLPTIGNIGLLNNEPILHVHGSFSNKEFNAVYAGHINKLIVGATLEVNITVYAGTITREFDEVTCLNLMSLK